MFYQKWKNLFFGIPSKTVNYADYLVNFKLLHKDIRNLQVLSAEDLDFIKRKIRIYHCLLFALITTMCLNIYQKENLML